MPASSHATDAKQNQKDQTRSTDSAPLNKESTLAFGAQHSLLSLHRSIGNRAFGQVLQAKLAISSPGDVYEQEADRIADQVMATPVSDRPTIREAHPQIQRFSGQLGGPPNAVPASVNQVLASSGRPLDPALRQDMEQRFGHDFSRVRVHSGAEAEQSARDVNAHAYTVGHNLVFGAYRFAPGTYEGRRLIAHELTHVVQQSSAGGNSVGQSNKGGCLSPSSVAHPQPYINITPQRKVQRSPGDPTPKHHVKSKQSRQNSSKWRYYKISFDKPLTRSEFIDLLEMAIFGRRVYKEWEKVQDQYEASDSPIEARVLESMLPSELRTSIDLAQAEFDAVDPQIKKRLAKPGGQRLTTSEEQLGFASFAKELKARGVTDEELIFFQTHNRGGVNPRHRFDWANDWKDAVDEVLGSRGKLEKAAAQYTGDFGALGVTFTSLSDEAYGIYKASQLMPGLEGAAEEQFEEAGTSLTEFENNRDLLLELFDERLRLETFTVLDKFEGGLLLTQERFVRDKGALPKIDAMRTAARSSEVLALKSRKEQLGHEKDAARDAYAATLIEHVYSPGAQQVKDAEKTMESADAAYNEAKQNYLNGLEDVSGVPVASWRGFNVDQFFYAKSADRSQNVLEGFIAQTLRDLTRARRELGKDMRTIYKADMMIRRTKNVLGVVSGSTVDKLIDDRVEEYKTAPWWERLLDILSIALIFVPGGAAITAIRVGVGVAQTVTTIENEALAETLSRAEVKQEGGSVANVAISAVGNVADVGDIAKVLKGGSAVLDTASQVEKTAAKAADTSTIAATTSVKADTAVAKGASDLPTPHVTPDTPVPSSTVPHSGALEPPVRTDVPAPPSTSPPTPVTTLPPNIANAKPTSPEEAFGSLKQELKDVPEATGPVSGQSLGAATPGLVQSPKPRRQFSPEERRASAQRERQMAADKKKDVLDDMNQRAPDVHKDVVKPGVRLQNGRRLEDFAVNNPDRVELLHAEWVDGVAKGNIKKNTSFSAYVKRRVAGDRGLAGELEDAFVRGPDEILVKAPKKKSNLRGTDSMSYRVREDRIKYLDNKSITTGASVGKVSAIEKNLAENISDDIADIERSIRLPDVPPEIEQIVLPRLKAARAELEAYIKKKGLRPEDMYSPEVRDAFDSILRNNGIDRVVTFGGAGQGARVSAPLSGAAGFDTERP